MAQQYDLAVIGAGPGGYIAAIEAAKKGMKTVVVESRQLGGTCLNRGCIPTKTILHATELYRELQNTNHLGIEIDHASYDMKKIQLRKEEVLEKLRGGIALLLKKYKVTLLMGTATIIGAHEINITGDETTDTIRVENVLIATGSKPAIPPIPGIDLPNVVNSDDLLSMEQVYQKLIIIGGGVIGMEFASIYSDLGCEVTVIEAMDRILPNMEKEISQNLKMIMKKRGVEIHTGATVQQIYATGDGRVKCQYIEKGALIEKEAEGILIAVGRQADTKGLFDKKLDIIMDRGRIVVNEKFQTNYPNVYAIGDVIGGYQLAHTASAQGINAVAYMSGMTTPPIDLEVVPSCVYTSPEIASVGFTEEQAKKVGLAIKTNKYLMSSNGKSLLTNQERGFIKVVYDEGSGKILGAQMMCARATDMISEFGTAIVNGLTVKQMVAVIRPHPTFSEGISEIFL